MPNYKNNFNTNIKDLKKTSYSYFKNYFSYFASNIAETTAMLTLSYYVKTKGSVLEAKNYIQDNVDNETTREFIERLVRDVPEENIIKLSEKYSKEDFKDYMYSLESDFDRLSTPNGISELASKLLDLNCEDTLIDLGSGTGSFLSYVDKNYKVRDKFGVEIDTSNYIVSNLKKLLFNSDANFILGNMLTQDFKELKSNKVFSNPPLGNRFSNSIDFNEDKSHIEYFGNLNNNVTGDWSFALAAMSQQALTGKCVVIMSNAATWNKSDEQIRRLLIEKGEIEGIILLPDNLYPKFSVSLSMVIFSSKNKVVKMVDASRLFTEGRKINSLEDKDIKMILDAYNNETSISRFVSFEELSSKDYILSPTRYIRVSKDMHEFKLIGELVHSITRGAMITASELNMLSSSEATRYQYLMLQNIREGVITNELPGLISIDERYERFCLSDGDLVVSKISPFKIARAHVEKGKKVLANGNLYFIKVDTKKINPIYLEFILQSEIGISQLNRLAKGSTIKNISIQDLKEVRIPMISLESQRMIAEQFQTICDDLVLLEIQSQKLKEKRELLINEVI